MSTAEWTTADKPLNLRELYNAVVWRQSVKLGGATHHRWQTVAPRSHSASLGNKILRIEYGYWEPLLGLLLRHNFIAFSINFGRPYLARTPLTVQKVNIHLSGQRLGIESVDYFDRSACIAGQRQGVQIFRI